MPVTTHLLIANPAARSGRNASRIDRAKRAIQKHGIRCEFLPTLPEEQTVSALREVIEKGRFQCLIAMGGDGTLREVAQALFDSGRQTEIPLAMLPAGTANNHGRSFGLDTSDRALEDNVAVIVRGHETLLDLGQLELHHDTGQTRVVFIDSVGFGIGARVIARRQLERRRFREGGVFSKVYRDMAVYTVATLQSLCFARETDEFGVTIVANGQTRSYGRLTELLVKGTRVYAGSWIIDRTSKHDDGLFEVVAYTDNRRWVAKGLLDLVKSDQLDAVLDASKMELPKPWRASHLEIAFDVREDRPLPAIQVDGDLFAPAKRATIDVLPRALRLIVPLS